MTKFKIGDKVRVIGSEIDFKRKEIGLEFVISSNEGEYDGEASWTDYGPGGERKCVWRWKDSELELIEQETPVTEFRAGDVVKVLRHRNGYGDNLGTGEPVGQTIILSAIEPEINDDGSLGDFEAWNLKDSMYWVRSDDIELVSRKEEPLTVELTSEMIDWEEALFGNHETENIAAVYNITRFSEELVSLKIKKGFVWTSEDLIELGSHLFALAEYLETGTVDLSDDCIECENEHLRDSNERLVSANDAKRQRLAKIRELTEV